MRAVIRTLAKCYRPSLAHSGPLGKYRDFGIPGRRNAAWFQRYGANDRSETFERIGQSSDTANKATGLRDFSICTNRGINGEDRQ